ncbi:protein involved in polysaccharide export, contains SLBB domain of the beta-grasp fold [Fervidobacterium changbaicum]|uniref:Polysaccharide export protein n=1 Tax=Fervidobacterium changbaicum TaxID=310769 RepID=A0ABX5QT95_9BACT|nr:polysaccharide biosynthesis/export family protein [Fervidobacterium changbaicum]QAV33751.1 polysaccharide export protein [Fervidobacterium changbaicum]SDH31878.1 protein involved in polysaccharide export, contains SLBB domain of the beta-grasp fold [Fervidobacterium changbaicum]
MKKVFIGTILLLTLTTIFAYAVRVGDTIAIEVFGQTEFSRTVKVAFDGTIPYPYAGNVKVVGLTTDQIKSIIEQTVRRFIKDPVVTVYVVDYGPMYVYLQGAINRTFDISNYKEVTLTQLFSLLGLSPSSEIDFETIQLRRAGKTQTLNMLSYFYDGTITDDPKLQEGDVIYFPPLKYSQTIQVSGAYTYIGRYEPGMTLKTLILRLGTLDKEKAVLESSYLTISGKTIVVNLEDVISGKIDYPILSGSSLYIPKREERFIYVVGFVPSPGPKTFLSTEPLTLAYALAKSGGISPDNEKWIEKITITTPDGKTREYTPDIIKSSENLLLQTGSIVNVVKYPEFKVYLTGDFSTGLIVFEPTEPKTLKTLLTKVGGLKTDQLKWIEWIKINNKLVDLAKLDDYTLSNNDSVEIKKYPEFRVYVTGDYKPGIVSFEPDEPRTLEGLLTKLGGIPVNEQKWIESVTINGQPADISKAASYMLNNGDKVEIRRYAEFKIYLSGDFETGVINFEPQEPKTLKTLLTKIGGLKTDQLKWIESIKINDKAIELSKLETYTLRNGDSVEIKKYPEFYVYVQGYANAKGKIVFEPQEPKTLKTLINKIGLTSPDVENEGQAIINNATAVALKDVVYSNKDVPLSLGDTVLISYEPFLVYVTGSGMPGVVQLSYYEPKTLSYIFKKLVNTPENIEQVTLVRNGKETVYSPNDLLYGLKDSVIERNDTVVFKQAHVNAVYLIGDVSSYVSFALNEPITIQRILAKVGLSDFRRIESITLDGTNVNFTSDISIPKGAILNVQLKKPVFVTAMGYIRNTGRVQFDYYETPDLKTLFAKLGGLIVGPENYYASDKVLVIREGKLIGQFDAENIFKGIENAELKDGDFVYVTQKDPNQVYVFGKGVPNGLFKFTQGEEFDLRTLIGKLGGIKEGVSRKLTIVTGDKVESIKWDEYTNFKLTSNSIILFDVDKENYVYIIRQDGRPDMIYTDKPTTLYEILTKVGIDKNYRKIELTRGTEKQTLELKDLAQARGYNVYPGDIVRVLDVLQNYAFVFGEVNQPGIIKLTEGMTVLQAILLSGSFTQKAAPSSVWLYKGGVEGKPIQVDLSATVSGGVIKFNPVVENGDIIFVPSDPWRSALDWLPVITSLLGFYTYTTNLFGGSK